MPMCVLENSGFVSACFCVSLCVGQLSFLHVCAGKLSFFACVFCLCVCAYVLVMYFLFAVLLSLAVCVPGELTGRITNANFKGVEKYFGECRAFVQVNGVEVSSAMVFLDGSFIVPGEFDTASSLVSASHPLLTFPYVQLNNGALTIPVIDFGSPYVAEEAFDVFQLFKNPMVIMGLVMVVLVGILPKLQGSPEDMNEMRKGLEDDNGMAANLLKKMMPQSAPEPNLGIPTLTVDKKNK